MKDWTEIKIQGVFEELRNVNHRHIAFVVGSAVSSGQPSKCPCVGHLQQAVLDPLSDVLRDDTDAHGKILAYLRTPSELPRDRDCAEFSQALKDLPFEQFMACLHFADKKCAQKIIGAAYGGCTEPNNNHLALARLVKILLHDTSVERVSILTTNYDCCIEHAFEQSFNSAMQPVDSIPVPAWEMETGQHKRIRYAKLHGCITASTPPILTVDQMGRLISDRKWVERIQNWLVDSSTTVDVAVFAGYGFWDPDLYPLFHRLTAGSIVIRNARRRSKVNELLGRAVLQHDALGRWTGKCYRMCFTTLLKDPKAPNFPSIFIDLVSLFSNGYVRFDVPSEPDKCQIEEKLASAKDCLLSLPDERKKLFWGRLFHACGRKEGRELFNRTLHTTSDMKIRNEMAKAYLHSFGNANDWQGATKTCTEFTKASEPIDLRVLGYAYRSFMFTIGDKTNPLKAMQDLDWGKELLDGDNTVDDCVRRFFEIYEIHFRVKTIEAAYQGSKDWGRVLGLHRVLRSSARRMMLNIEKMLNHLHELEDAESIGDTTELLAQMSIIAGDLERAMEAAEKAQLWRSFIGRMSNALQSDRLLGWLCLARGGEERRRDAVRLFARGFERALDVPDERSLAEKLGANLIRAVWANDLDGLSKLTGKDREIQRLKKACRLLQASGTNAEAIAGDVTEYVLYLFGEKEHALKEEIAKLSDLERYPIYLPLRA